MNTYTVIWRDAGDDYMFTVVHTSDDPADVPNIGWVQTAAMVEYADWDEKERIVAIGDLITEGYDLLAVVKGELEYVA
jgi:ABC-type sugar transport system substrate-binding protein